MVGKWLRLELSGSLEDLDDGCLAQGYFEVAAEHSELAHVHELCFVTQLVEVSQPHEVHAGVVREQLLEGPIVLLLLRESEGRRCSANCW